MKIHFEINKNGSVNYNIGEDIGFEVPKCRHCGRTLEVDKLKSEGVWLFCNNPRQDHEDDALMQYEDGKVEYLDESPWVYGE